MKVKVYPYKAVAMLNINPFTRNDVDWDSEPQELELINFVTGYKTEYFRKRNIKHGNYGLQYAFNTTESNQVPCLMAVVVDVHGRIMEVEAYRVRVVGEDDKKPEKPEFNSDAYWDDVCKKAKLRLLNLADEKFRQLNKKKNASILDLYSITGFLIY